MSQTKFEEILGGIAKTIADKPVDASLAKFLDAVYPVDSEVFTNVETLCKDGEAEGWICGREHGGIKFGRVVKQGGSCGKFSVDVVRMSNIKGPHHVHPNGEIGMVMPISGDPRFDGFPRGWYVDPPGSDHWPTVEGGDAYVLYLLPDGAIQFTGK